MATHTNVSKTNQPTNPHASSGIALLIACLAIILAISLVAVSTLIPFPQAGPLSASGLSLDAAADRYQGLAGAYVPLRLGVTGTWAARYEGLASAYAIHQPVAVQALNAWSARYTGQARPYTINAPISQRAVDAWGRRFQGAYSLMEVSAFQAVAKLSTSQEPISQRAMETWSAQYTAKANSFVPERLPISRPVFSAWVERSTGMAGAAVTQDLALNAWAARYTRQADRLASGKPVSQKALAAWTGRYVGMLAAIDGGR